MAPVEKQSSAPSGKETPYEITANLIVDNLNAALQKIIDSLQTTPNKASRDIPAEMTAAFNKAFVEFSGVFERAIAEDNLSPESLTALTRAQIKLTKLAKNTLGKVPTFQLGEPVPAVAPVTARPVVAERQNPSPAPPEKRTLTERESGVAQLKSPSHQCQDYSGSKYENGKLRVVVADGSGGSLSGEGLTQDEQDRLIIAKMQTYVQTALSDMSSKPEAAHRYGANVAESMRNNKAYGAGLVVDITKEGISHVGPGDVALILYGGPNHRFATRRTETPSDPGRPSPFQLINRIDNLAHQLRFAVRLPGPKTGMLDESANANKIFATFGLEEKGKRNEVPSTFVSARQLQDSGARYALMMTDGAQPSAMIDSDVDENRAAAQQLMDLAKNGRRAPLPPKYEYLQGTDPATGQLYDLNAEALSILKQTRYHLEVKSAMDTLSNGAITAFEAAQKIVQAARTTLGDQDDITVRIIDLRAIIPELK